MRTVNEDEDLMIMTSNGIIIRTAVSGISRLGRNTMGVTLIRVSEGDSVATVARIQKNDDNDDPDNPGADGPEQNEDKDE
ncbi:DNA gyrase C-terminal beta-propeller domain-containing protein [Terrilactibacillus sp. S3-3]|nr:DNA gyrase C-terminal beta-propeller domain-containing protein [Terrilactibacillus sp. S3-3]